MHFRKFLALLLSALMLLTLLPTVSAAESERKESGDIWELISDYEDAELSLKTRAAAGRTVLPTAKEFASLSEGVEAIVRRWDGFAEGTISRHGDFFFWEDVDGNAYGYSPRLREKMRQDAANATADPEELAGVETVSFARGGSAGGKNVATFQPYYGIDGSFTTQYANEATRIAKALGGTGTTYKTTTATVDQVANALETCGVVIFDSHGDTDYANGDDYTSKANTSYLCMQTNAGWTSADQKSVTGPYGTYYHAYNAGSNGSMKYYCVDGTVFANHMTGEGCNNMLWMAICLGMATDGMNKPLHDKGVEVVYGYSQSVSFDGDYDYEKQFWNHMIDGYTAGESFAYMKNQCGCDWDPAYASQASTEAQARQRRIAFPIMVSSEDPYPGHGNVDRVTTPTSTWTLYTQYTVTAVSSNTAWGTVSVNGTTITASPKTGYYAAGYTVTSGTATVAQNGNVFTVTPSSDCTVRIDFAAKTPATIRFVTPEGVTCADISTYVGDDVTLPVPSGKPTADAHEYSFLGWTLTETDNSTVRPAYLTGGSTITVSGDATYTALYTYVVAEGAAVTGFQKVVADPGDWDGEYILTYNSDCVLDASGTYTGAALGSKDAAPTLAATGMTLSGSAITNESDSYVYVIEASAVTSGAWTIRMKNSGNYLAYKGDNTNSITTTTNGKDVTAQWNLSFSGETVSIRNVNASDRYFQYNTTSKVFRCYKNTMKNLTLFAGETGTRYYTTVLTTAAAHVHACALVAGVPPTCTEPGSAAYLYCAGCGKLFSYPLWEETHELVEITLDDVAIPAPGHSPGEPVEENRKDPTCTEAGGFDTVVYCTVCNIEISRTHTDVEALDHAWGEPTYQWTEDYSTCTATRVCKRDESHVEEETVKTIADVTIAPTVEAEGEMTYTAIFTNPAFTTQTKTAAISKLDPTDPCAGGHDWGEPTYQWAEDYSACTATRVCKNNAEHVETETAEAAGVVTKPATLEEEGEIIYTAAFKNEVFGMREIAVPIPKLEPPTPVNPFDDVKDSAYYYEPVLWAVNHDPQITNGTGAATFSPEDTCTRGQVVTFLWRAKGCPEPTSTENPFKDVKDTDYFYKAVLWAKEADVTTGTDATHFSPNDGCTRAQVVTFLWRAEGEPVPTSTENPFKDVPKDAYYTNAVLWAVEKGITNGTDPGKFSPNATCTRGQIVTFLYRDMA